MLDEIRKEISQCMEYFHCIKDADELASHQLKLEHLLWRESQYLARYDY